MATPERGARVQSVTPSIAAPRNDKGYDALAYVGLLCIVFHQVDLVSSAIPRASDKLISFDKSHRVRAHHRLLILFYLDN